MHSLGYYGTIEYNEFKQSSYQCIKISDRNSGFEKIFSNEKRCPILDHAHLMEFLSEQNQGVRWSSSYDHFFMDGRRYVERYVTFNGDSEDPDKWEFVTEIEKIWNDEYDFTVISSSRIKTFQNLRKYIKRWKR